WGIGKSSLLLKFAAICSDPKYGILPVLVPVSTDYGDYRRFAESLLDGLAEALAATSSLTTRLRTEVRNWKLKRVSMGGFTLDREALEESLSFAVESRPTHAEAQARQHGWVYSRPRSSEILPKFWQHSSPTRAWGSLEAFLPSRTD